MAKHDDLERAASFHHWWPKATAVRALRDLLEQLEEAPDDARFTIRRGITEKGVETPWLCVEGGQENYEGYDDLYPCPPRC